MNLNWCSSPINNNINPIKEFKFFKQRPFTRLMNWPQKVGLKTNLEEVSFFMTKYSTEFKVKIVQEYFNKEGGYKYLTDKYQIMNTEEYMQCLEELVL